MYTVCPKCALTLVVTAADLRVAQGFVRCGRCSNVFNALARLSEDRSASSVGVASPTLSQPIPPQPPPEPEPPAPESESPEPQQPLADGDSIPDTALEFDPDATDVSKVFVERAPDPQWTAATGKFKALLKKMQPASGAQGASGAPTAAPRGPAQAPSQPGTPRPGAVPASQPNTPQPNAPQASQSNTGGAARTTTAPARGPQAPPSQTAQRSAAPPTGNAAGAPASHAAPPAAPPSAPAAHAVPPPSATPPQKIPTDEDAQFDIEVDAEFLAATAQFKPQSPPPQPARQPTASPTESPATPATRPAATPTPVTPPQAAPPASASPTEANEDAVPTRPPPPRAPARPAATPRATMQDVGFGSREDAEDAIADEEAAAAKASAAALLSRPALTHLWGAGTAVLMLLLAAQIVHHYRHDLAASDRLYRPLTALYSALGVSLVPRWNLAAYDVRQLGASADNTNTGQITVRASVKNTAKHAQPLPLLRVTLQDRFGNRIAARDVPPKAYLPSAIPASSFLSAGQRIDAEMAFVDPGTNAVGFEIDACLPAPGGSIACANDSAR